MQAFIYCRVSTEEQASEGVSLEAQKAKAEAWAALNGYTVAGVFTDAGLSGSRADNRPALQDALAAACGVRGAALVAYSLSRLARNTRDALDIAKRLERAGVDLVSLSEKIDTSSASGRMVYRLMANLSEYERDQIAERTKAALQQKKRKGERVGTVPYGWELAADGVQLVEVAEEQAVLAIVRELRAAGMSMRTIAEELTKRGIQTKKGGATWKHSTIQGLLRAA
jgi:DNA invertase Pin-like site-specific DNA recombinase